MYVANLTLQAAVDSHSSLQIPSLYRSFEYHFTETRKTFFFFLSPVNDFLFDLDSCTRLDQEEREKWAKKEGKL